MKYPPPFPLTTKSPLQLPEFKFTSDINCIVMAEVKSKGRVGVVQETETGVRNFKIRKKTDVELEASITRINKNLMTIGHFLPDKVEKLKAYLERGVDEVQRRRRIRAKRMRRLRDELEAEKKQTNKVEGKLMDAETKIIQLKANIFDLQEKLHDSSVQLDAGEKEKKELAERLDIAEKNCASVADDSKWFLQEGLSFFVQKLVNESSKENFMTVSELRDLHLKFMSGSS